MEKEKKQEAQQQSDKIHHRIHTRPDCVDHSLTKKQKFCDDPNWCLICFRPVAECPSWEIHCHETGKQVEKEMVEKIEKAAVVTKEQGLSMKKVAKQVEKEKAMKQEKGKAAKIKKAMVLNKENKEKDDEGEKMAEIEKQKAKEEEMKAAVISMEQVKKYLTGIMEMEESTLKALCKKKGILPKGRSTMKHKYAFALFRDALM